MQANTATSAEGRVRRSLRVALAKLGEHRGAKRVYLQGLYLLKAGFAPARYIEAEFATGRVTLRVAPTGPRVVSSKRDGAIPVIDLNTNSLRAAFGEIETVQVQVFEGEIVLTPAMRDEKCRNRCRNGRAGSIFGGAGLLARAAERAGFTPAFCIEADERYADAYARNFPEAQIFNMPVEQVSVELLPPVELLEIGVPCEPFNRVRAKEKGTGKKRDRTLAPESHPSGDLTIFAALVVSHLNPAHIIIENVPEYLNSGAGWMMRHFLERLGYTVDARVVDATEYGELQMRRRTVIIATSDGEPVRWPKPCTSARLLGDIFDAPEEVEGAWFTEETKAWIFHHWRSQQAAGNNFASAVLDGLSRFCPGIKKRYLAGQGDNPVIRNPKVDRCFRFLTLRELRRLFGVDDAFILPDALTVAGEGLCQGVIVTLFEKIIRAATGRATMDECEQREEAGRQPGANAPQLAFAF